MAGICGNCFAELIGEKCSNCGYEVTSSSILYALPTGTVLNKRHLIGKVIGKGGFGITYLAYDMQLDKTVAVKEYFPQGMAIRASDDLSVEILASEQQQLFGDGIDKFYREAALISNFKENAAVINIFDVFRENGTAYYVMEFVHGVTLKDYVTKNGALSEGQIVYILRRILEVLAVLHKSEIVHRDISPENIMLCIDNSVKLVDFGAARHIITDSEDSLSVILKPGFAPLEQYQRKGIQGAWTDIYSLGLSAYYGLTCLIPDDPMTRFDDDSIFMNAIDKLSPELKTILQKSAEIRRENRYANAEEMLLAVNGCEIAEEGFDITAVLTENSRQRNSPITADMVHVSSSAIRFYKENYTRPDKIRIGSVFYPIDSEKLDLSYLELTNAAIANLKHMKKLKTLILNDNYITDLSVLKPLVQLERLFFNNNNVQNIDFAENMQNLISISGENSGISDLSPLKGKTRLKDVFFGNSYVTDVSPLKDSRELEKIGFNEMQIGDLEAFRGMTKISMICLSGCNISDISPLSESHGLKYVYIGRNEVTDLSPLKKCDEIFELYADRNPLKDSIDTFAGITVRDYVIINGCGFTAEDIQMIHDSMYGKFTIEY